MLSLQISFALRGRSPVACDLTNLLCFAMPKAKGKAQSLVWASPKDLTNLRFVLILRLFLFLFLFLFLVRKNRSPEGAGGLPPGFVLVTKAEPKIFIRFVIARLVKLVSTTDLKSVLLMGYRFKSDSEQSFSIVLCLQIDKSSWLGSKSEIFKERRATLL